MRTDGIVVVKTLLEKYANKLTIQANLTTPYIGKKDYYIVNRYFIEVLAVIPYIGGHY